jgi:hypothetical protein
MAVSSSPEGWQASALIFSGRANPTWRVPPDVAVRLVQLWEELRPERPAPVQPALGYAGVRLLSPAGQEWTAAQGQVILREAGRATHRADPQRTFERAVLGTAPAGAVPSAMVPAYLLPSEEGDPSR